MQDSREMREKRILEVAKNHFAKYGYKRTVIDDIVREVGIAKGTFYLHFGSKEDLFFRVFEEMRATVWVRWGEILSKPISPGVMLRESLCLSLKIVADEPLLNDVMNNRGEDWIYTRVMSQPGWAEEAADSQNLVNRLLMEGIESGEFRPDLDPTASFLLMGGLKIIAANFEVLRLMAPKITQDKLVEIFVDTAMRSIANPNPPDQIDPKFIHPRVSAYAQAKIDKAKMK